VEDLTRLIQTTTSDANAEIDAPCARMNAGDVDIAIHLLTDLRKKRWDRMSPRERYRVVANLGHALEQKGELKKAAQFYLEEKQHQQEDEKARTFEAIAYYHLDEKANAYALTEEILKDHPNCSIAVAVRIRTAPPDVSFDALDQAIPAVLREEID